MNFVLVLGSIRPNRQSEKPAHYLADLLASRGHQVNFLDLRELDLPLFNDSPEQFALPNVQRFIHDMQAADGIFLVTPEYNHNYSSATKNAIDYLRHWEIKYKPVGLVGVSDGDFGGARGLMMARASLPTLGVFLLPMIVPVRNVITTFPDARTCNDPKVVGQMEVMIKEMEAFAPAIAAASQTLTQS